MLKIPGHLRLLVLAYAVMGFGSGLVDLASIHVAFASSGALLLAAVVLASRAIAAALITTLFSNPLVGESRRLLALGILAHALVCALTGLLSWSGYLNVPWLIGTTALHGAINAFATPVGLTYRHDLTPPELQVQTHALFSSRSGLAAAAGSLAAGFLIHHHSEALAFAASAVALAASAGLVALNSVAGSHIAPHPVERGLLQLGSRTAAADSDMRRAIAVLVASSLLCAPLLRLLPDVARAELTGPRALAVATAAMLAGAALIVPLASFLSRHYPPLRLLAPALLVQAPLLMGLGWAADGLHHYSVLAVLALFVLGAAMALVESLVLTIFQIRSPNQERRAVMAFYTMLGLLAPLGGMLAAGVADHLTVRPVLLACGGLLLAFVLVFQSRSHSS